ncbi:MAG: ATP-dependent sacrificial sulfur transferase LarE [Planctomycetota bacterium]
MSKPDLLESRIAALRATLAGMGRVAVAFSAGIDSTLVLQVATELLGENAIGFMGLSASVPPGEVEEARALALHMGARLEFIEPVEMEDPAYRRNETDRCYYCKSALYGRLREIARERHIPWIADGLHLEDQHDLRPGQQAADELGVRHPLMEAGFTKADVRECARRLGLPNWEKPAMACLASRVPFGTPIDEATLRRVGEAERRLKALGFSGFRVRHHGALARLELVAADWERALAMRERLVNEVKQAGYAYVALDLEGYRMGSAHEAMRAGG